MSFHNRAKKYVLSIKKMAALARLAIEASRKHVESLLFSSIVTM